MALQFTRDVQVAVKLSSDIWEVPVLDGFSFSQAINASEITVNEAGSTSRRGRLLFNDSLAPVEWSFSTYARPTVHTSQSRCIEEALWAMYVGASSYSNGIFSGTSSPAVANAISTTATNTFNLTQSDISSMTESFEIYFMFKPTGGTNQVYKITKAAVNSVTIDFDIDGIATIQWSGFGSELSDEGTNIVTPTITDGVDSSDNFIRNRISTVSMSRTDLYVGEPTAEELTAVAGNVTDTNGTDTTFTVDEDVTAAVTAGLGIIGTNIPSGTTVVSATYSDPDTTIVMSAASTGTVASPQVYSRASDVYNIVLTGGSINLENNISYLTPEELGQVNKPLGNITGTRSISGNLTCYLDNNIAESKSGELFKDLVSDTDTVRNQFALSVNIGGAAAPALSFVMPTAHLEVPVINVEDLLTLDIAFHAQAAGGNIDNQNEATIVYKTA